MMDYAIFKEVMREQILEHLPEEFKGSTVEVRDVEKVNVKLDGMVVLKPSVDSSPTVYLNHLYEDYVSGKSIQDCLSQCANVIVDAYKELEDMKPRIEISQMKENVVMVLVNQEQNKDMLENIPHRDFQDLAVIYRWVLDINEKGIASSIVTNKLMESEGMTEPDLFQLAVENTKRLLPPQIKPMSEVIKEMFPFELVETGMLDEMMEEINSDPKRAMYVLTNETNVNGAVSMLYENNLHELAEKLGTDLYILPSSIHESILVSVEMGEPDDLAQMVSDINMDCVDIAERLSNNVYHYDKDLRKVTLATDSPNKRLDGKVSEPPMVYEAQMKR